VVLGNAAYVVCCRYAIMQGITSQLESIIGRDATPHCALPCNGQDTAKTVRPGVLEEVSLGW
jgi:hypothetical protein